MSQKKVLVTGSSRGIGNSILDFFSNEEFIPIGTATSSSGVEIIKENKAISRVCLASFSSSRLKKIRKLAGPDCCSSMSQLEVVYQLIKSINLPSPQVNGFCAQVPTSQWGIPIVTRRFIDYAHKKNKFVHVWTIDTESEMEKLIELGVDGLMTDRPSVLYRVMKKKNLI